MKSDFSIIVIGGGDSYNTDEEYVEALKFYQPRIYQNRSDWKSTLYNIFSDKVNVLIPTMPSKDNAKYEYWKITFEKILQLSGNNIILIGHSLGANFLSLYLSENKIKKNIIQLHFVAGCVSSGTFLEPTNWNQINETSKQIHIWHSTDDRIVDYTQALYYKEKLPKANLHTFENKGHFNSLEFEELFENIESVI
jgi:predicted alpha/beta hydrolase family esterase